jgi:hypothetical protein
MAQSEFVTPKCRFSRCYLFSPAPTMNPSDTPKYELKGLVPKNAPGVAEWVKGVQQAVVTMAKNKFNGKVPPSLKVALKDGDTLVNQKTGELMKDKYPEFEGMWVVHCKSKYQPKVWDQQTNKEIVEPNAVKSGYWGRVGFDPFVWERPDGCGVSFGLNTVLLMQEDEVLGGGGPKDPRDDFEEYLADTPQGEEASATTDSTDVDDIFK